MVYFYDETAGNEQLKITNEQFSHLKARRLKAGERIDVRNLKDGFNYIYEIIEISRKEALCELVFKNSVIEKTPDFTVAWAVVENAVIEKTLPLLNEIGIGKVILVYSDFSQKNIKPDLKRMDRILINSSQQCGRNSILEIEILNSSDELLKKFQDKISLIDFGGKSLEIFGNDEIAFVGPEGGFSERERKLFKNSYAINSPYILRSNTAILSVCAKLLF